MTRSATIDAETPGPTSASRLATSMQFAQVRIARPAALPERALAALLLYCIGTGQRLGSGLADGFTVGGVLALVMFPVWVRSLREYWGARVLTGCGALAVASGLILSDLALPEHAVGRGLSVYDSMLLVDVLTGIGVILWSRQLMPVSYVGLWFGLGLLCSLVLAPDSALATDPWKFGGAVATAVVVLSVVNRPGRRIWEFTLLLVLAGLSITFDSRSYFATFLLAAMLTGWQSRPQLSSRRAAWTWTVAMMAGLAVVIYYLGTTLLVGGYLGKAAQARSVQQIDTAGSLILGGRPELAASLALFEYHPSGFGVGVAPTMRDVLVAKAGMAKINYDPNNLYVEQFMFGGHIELHSTTGDIWAHYGIAGLLFVVVLAFLVLRGLAESISRRTGSALLLFLSCWTFWNLLFSPFLSAAPTLMLAVGLALGAHRAPARHTIATARRKAAR